MTSPEVDPRIGMPHALRRPPLTGARGEHELVAVAQHDHDAARLDERAAALDDQLEHALELGLGADRERDRLRRLQPPHGPLELVRPSSASW